MTSERQLEAIRGPSKAVCGLPPRPQREVVPDPARLERAATLTNCGPDAPLPAGCVLGGLAPKDSHQSRASRAAIGCHSAARVQVSDYRVL
jgi:hypothetical protein